LADLKYRLFRSALEALYFSGSHIILKPLIGGVGAIITLHHVRPPRHDQFQPNRLLEVTPDFFETVIRRLRRSRTDIVSMDEVHRRITERDFSRRFISVTFDDGYRDTLECAYPILKRHDVPFTIYVATSFADRIGELWWLALEAVVAQNQMVGLQIDGRECWFHCPDVHQKRTVYNHIYWWLRGLKSEQELRAAMRDLASRHKVSMRAFCAELCMDWQELSAIAADPLVTVGAHTVNHPILSKIDEAAVRAELENCRAVIEATLGTRPQHLAYPVGDRTSAGPREFKIAAELGFKTAVTTRPGVLYGGHAKHLMALPRISLNGEFQRQRYAKVLLSGAATGLWNGFRRLNVT
jgi:peptidoglycan/xylan/chitin deacetylase (PgdA/CDA1 family)